MTFKQLFRSCACCIFLCGFLTVQVGQLSAQTVTASTDLSWLPDFPTTTDSASTVVNTCSGPVTITLTSTQSALYNYVIATGYKLNYENTALNIGYNNPPHPTGPVHEYTLRFSPPVDNVVLSFWDIESGNLWPNAGERLDSFNIAPTHFSGGYQLYGTGNTAYVTALIAEPDGTVEWRLNNISTLSFRSRIAGFGLNYAMHNISFDCPAPSGASVPTLSQWGLVVLGLLMLSLGAVWIRRKILAVN